MFEVLMKNLLEERTKLLDRCTKKLIKHAGFDISENPSNMEFIMMCDDMSRNGYKIRHSYDSGNKKDSIQLIHREDLYKSVIAEFIISIECDEDRISIVAKEIVENNL
jgi:hypothetical protein